MKRLSIVIPVLNQHDLAMAIVEQLIKATDFLTVDTDILIIDNGSNEKLATNHPKVRVVRNEKSTGVYATFEQGFRETTGDVVLFMHSDLAIWEDGWNRRMMDDFDADKRLGMVGFIGSNEIDNAGGRGLGTVSNFMGKTLTSSHRFSALENFKIWTGSPAEVHGKRTTTLVPAAVVDGCAMAIRRSTWADIGYRTDYIFHHFYDKIISCQVLEHGWKIGVLGIECDHFSGQTVNQEPAYRDAAILWGKTHGLGNMKFDNADEVVYKDSETKFLREFRDEKHLIPLHV